MEWTDTLRTICEVCIIPLLGVITAYVVALIRKKTQQLTEKTKNEQLNRVIDLVSELVCKAVQTTNQTYVESLKDKNLFDVKAQKEAFDLTYKTVLTNLNQDAQDLIIAQFGDLTTYLTAEIESKVNDLKN